MSSILLSGPAVEPITLAEAKLFLRIEHDDDNDVIMSLIAAARAHVESTTRRALITQTWRHVRDAWPADGRIAILPVPLQQVTTARVYRSDGTTLAIDPTHFTADLAAAPAVLAIPSDAAWPERDTAGIEIDVRVGYGDAAADVPEPLRQAIRLLIAHWYENRGVISLGHQTTVLPTTVQALIGPYRVLGL